MGVGRPRGSDSQARYQEFLRLIAAGERLPEAARRARMSDRRALRLLDDRDVLAFVVTVRRDDAARAA